MKMDDDVIKVSLRFSASGTKHKFPPVNSSEAIKAWSKKLVAEWQAEQSANNTK